MRPLRDVISPRTAIWGSDKHSETNLRRRDLPATLSCHCKQSTQHSSKLSTKHASHLAVGPVTTVSSPSGNIIDRSFSSNLWSATVAVSLSVVRIESVSEAALLPFLSLSSSGTCSTSFHLNDALSKPRRSSSDAEAGPERSFFRDETCSETSASSR